MTKVFNEKEKSFYDFGNKIFGPFLYGYSNWLYNSIKEKNLKKVFFFSRDGYMMLKAFAHILNYNNDNSTTYEYVYFSRKSLRTALLWKENSYIDSLKYLSKHQYISLMEILEYYGFDKNQCCEISNKYSIDSKQLYVFDKIETNKELNQIYFDYKDDIDKNSKNQYEALKVYLEQIHMEGDCAIVDIGWYGNMQWYLEKFIEQAQLKVNLFGYYIGIKTDKELKSETFGYIYSNQKPKKRKEILCFFGILERLFQGFDGSTKGYLINNGKVEVIKEQYEFINDLELIENIKSLQLGAEDFIVNNLQIPIKDYFSYSKNLIRFGKNPSHKYLKLFKSFYNVDGQKTYYLAQKSLFNYKPKELMIDLCNSPWKTGFMKSVFKIPLPYYMIYKIFRR